MDRTIVALSICLTSSALCVRAGVVQGVVLEYVSGRPLARAVVRLDAVPQAGGAGKQLTMRAGRSGQFAFISVAPGSYLLSAAAEGYFRGAYGQRLPAGQGVPFQVSSDSEMFAELRLRHKGAVTGRVLDENGVGKAGVPVIAYRARLPLRAAGSGLSDDRGVYRVHGLEPGKYWVRTAAHTLDDGSGWLPTFSPQAREGREARSYQVGLDSDATDADVSPEPGTLFHLSGLIGCDSEGPVTVTLSSETGRRSTGSACGNAYRFDGLAPAAYEIFARKTDGTSAGFFETYLDRDNDSGTVQLARPRPTAITVHKGTFRGSEADVPVRLTGRRQDLSESEPEREITGRSVTLLPGYWEFRAIPPAGYYIESIYSWASGARRPWKAERADDWFEVLIESRFSSNILISVSERPGAIDGRVVTEGKGVPAAPVFLWPEAANARRSLGGSRQSLSDTDGRFHFEGLPPGDYRLLATFDASEVDEDFIRTANPRTVQAEAAKTANVELAVWSAPW